jgi:hypothetical protein
LPALPETAREAALPAAIFRGCDLAALRDDFLTLLPVVSARRAMTLSSA